MTRLTPPGSGLRAAQGPVLSGVSFHALGATPVVRLDPGNHRLLWPRSGSLGVRTDRTSIVLRPPLGLWVPAGTSCTLTSDQPTGVAHFSAASCPDSWAQLTRLTLDGVLPSLLSHVHLFPDREWAPHLASAIVEHLHDAFVRAAPALPLPTDPRARAVSDALVARPSDDRDLVEWTRDVGASESTLRRIFKVQTGMSFTTWRQLLRMQSAMHELAQGAAVGVVAAQVGYTSPEAFARAFKAYSGLSPTQFRARRATASGAAAGSQPLPHDSWPLAHDRSTTSLLDSLWNKVQREELGVRTATQRILAIAALALLTAACGDDEPASGVSESAGSDERVLTESDDVDSADSDPADLPAMRVVTEFSGREVEIPVEPERIVVIQNVRLFPTVLALGVTPVGVAGRENWQEETRAILGEETPDLDDIEWLGDRFEPNLESIAAVEPDVILAPFVVDDEQLASFTAIAPTVLLPVETVEEVTYSEPLMADILGQADRYEELRGELDQRLSSLADMLVVEDLTYSYMDQYDDENFIYRQEFLASQAIVFDALGLEESQGLVDALGDQDNLPMSTERLNDLDADLIFVGTFEGQPVNDANSTVLDTTTAAASDQVFAVPQALWSYSGLPHFFNLVDSLEDTLRGLELVDGPN